MLTFLALPALWVVFVLVLIIATAVEGFLLVTILLVLATAISAGFFYNHFDLWWLLNPIYIAPYVLVGLGWMFFRWTRYIDQYKHSVSARERGGDPPAWNSHHSSGFSVYFFYWPLDMIAYAVTDLLTELWQFVHRLVSKPFDAYAQWRWNRS